MEKAKADKKIRFFGFSTHKNMENCLQEAAKLGWVDGIMLKYDFALMQTDAMKAAMDAATKAGIGLTAMKTQNKSPIATETEADLKLGGHFIQRGFTQQQAKIKAVWENPQIASLCSQMPNLTVLQSNIAAALDKTSLTAADHAALREYAEATRSRHCAGCAQFCEAATGHQVPVGDVMRTLMYHRSYGDPELARTVFRQLPEHPPGAGRIRLCGGGTGVSARPAHCAMDAGSRRIVRVVYGDFVTEAGRQFRPRFVLSVLVPQSQDPPLFRFHKELNRRILDRRYKLDDDTSAGWGRTGFDLGNAPEAACRGWFVGLVKNRTKTNS